jgi:hypothetical protein
MQLNFILLNKGLALGWAFVLLAQKTGDGSTDYEEDTTLP